MTQVITNVADKITFGKKHKGKEFIDVARHDPGWVAWAIDNDAIDLDEEIHQWWDHFTSGQAKSGRY